MDPLGIRQRVGTRDVEELGPVVVMDVLVGRLIRV
jgi:hypothetical protein